MRMHRREFMRKTAYYGLGAATLPSLIQTFSLSNALAAPSLTYKALVCIFLNGGNDSNNMVVPIGAGPYAPNGYTDYFNARNSQSLALPEPGAVGSPINMLVPLLGGNPVPAGSGAALSSFAFHPSLTGLRDLFDQGKVAVVTNVGTLRQPLVSPTPRQAYLNAGNAGRPLQLFSHSDQIQQWQSCRADAFSANGWGGRTADKVPALSGALPQVTSISGNQTFTIGTVVSPLTIGTGSLNSLLVLSGFGTAGDEVARRNAMGFLRAAAADNGNNIVAATSGIMQQAVDVSNQLNIADPTATDIPSITQFNGNDSFATQLRQVIRIIWANQTVITPPLDRQIFFVSLGGFDTHSNQLTGQGGFVNGSTLSRGLLGRINDAMVAFFNCTRDLNTISAGISSRITTFTMADFNRTFNPAGSGSGTVGSDHAWGSHQFVMGDGVNGGRFYGVPVGGSNGNGTVFNSIHQMGSSSQYDSQSRGLWVPTCSVETFANTLVQWYGSLNAADTAHVFPLLSRFSPSTLAGLMI